MTRRISPQSLLRGSIELITLPDVYFRVCELIRDPEGSADDIAKVLSKDPALSARLLRIVNSSYYGFQARIDTITRAVAVVGIIDLQKLVVTTSVIDTFRRIPQTLVDMTEFWMRSIQCGVIARLLAGEGRVLHEERLFMAGLLHDIGSLLMYAKMPDECKDVLLAAGGDRRLVAGLEQELIGFTHADVGAALMRQWGLPESLQQAVGCHLAPKSAEKYRLEAHLVFLAARLCEVEMLGASLSETLAEVPDDTLSVTGLTENKILQTMTRVSDEFAAVFEVIFQQNVQ
ncbi:MAG: HDOD domain-containing protein [Pseudomonadota bacterium]